MLSSPKLYVVFRFSLSLPFILAAFVIETPKGVAEVKAAEGDSKGNSSY